MWGCVWNLLLLLSFKHHIPGVGVLIHFLTGTPTPVLEKDGEHWSPRTTDVFLALSLLCIQTSRRLLECLFVIEHSNRKMHAIHYIMGLYFYTSIGPTAMLHLNSSGEYSDLIYVSFLGGNLSVPYTMLCLLTMVSTGSN